MNRVRSVDFLPEIFQTDANKQFLAATLDQLIQEPKFKKTQGYIGRKIGPGVNANDKYVVEPSKNRNDYQLEPGIISLDPTDTTSIKNVITYPGINDALEFQGANGARPDLLYESEYYTWDSFIDWDAFVNFSQYFWVPNGPNVVEVANSGVATSAEYPVSIIDGAYYFNSPNRPNPNIQLVRGGNYTFVVNQSSNFWIQTSPGISGTNAAHPNISTRTVLGVSNNGTNNGTVFFNVPSATAQDFYYSLNDAGSVDLLTNLSFGDIQGADLDNFIAVYGGIDGVTNLQNRTLIFTDPSVAQDIWQISYVTVGPVTTLQLTNVTPVTNLSQLTISFGAVYSNTSWYKNNTGLWEQVPLLTAGLETLWYQDSANPDIFGRIDIIDQVESADIRISDIVGKKNYTSPNGVVFTNGLKVKFQQRTIPSSYGSGSTSVTITDTVSGLNLITTASTSNLISGQTIIFSGTGFGNIVPGQEYYVKDIFSGSQFSISVTQSGPAVVLVSATGTMTGVASQYSEYYVGGVGTAIKLLPVSNYVVPEIYTDDDFITISCTATSATTNQITCNFTGELIVGRAISFSGAVFGGVVLGDTYYVKSIVDDTHFTVSETVSGPVFALTTTSGQMSATSFVEPVEADYLTISRDSPDLNAWSRSNRWFHQDVLLATSTYNDTVAPLDQYVRAKRPIIQFRGGIKLFNMGTEAKTSVDTIDLTETDAFSNVEGQTSYAVNNYTFVDGSRVIFANDTDPNVRNKIYVVNFVSPDTISPIIAQPIINLVPAPNGTVLANNCTVVIDSDQKGQTYWFDGSEWVQAQQKTSVQQAPLFDMYDSAGVSFSSPTIYGSSTFTGTKLFSYAQGTGPSDPVLGFQLKYRTIGNVGDIVFDNNLYKDTFNYTLNATGIVENISVGFPYEYVDRTTYTRLLGWQTAVTPLQIRQQFAFTYDGNPLVLDVVSLTNQQTVIPAVQVFVGSRFRSPNTYTIATDSVLNTTTVTFTVPPAIGEKVEVLVISDQSSDQGFYQVPANLQQNPFNNNSDTFTLGTIRTHYETICQNLTSFSGNINGSNNTRDLGDIGIYGQTILQQSSPLTLAGYFLRSNQYNIWGALEYNSREYQKYKNQLLEAISKQTVQFYSAATVLDTAVAEITLGRTDQNPFYWSDMLPTGAIYQTQTHTVSYITNNVFDTNRVYDYATANFYGMNVYLNNRLLTRGQDYSVSTVAATITILEPLYSTLAIGDVISIREYSSTAGNFVPNTPTKVGCYPAWRPRYVEIKTTKGFAWILQGHDGSQTPVFGNISDDNGVLVSDDIRDQAMLEFETRIFNNLKLDGNPIPLTVADVLPGQFRSTGYSWNEINSILAKNLLVYTNWNKLNISTQEYNAANQFTWNYSQSINRLDGQYLLGAWRGIYRYWYDTEQPQLTPWEMLGFTIKPDWWEITYGPAPYTQDNLVLWQDLEAGLVRDPAGEYVLTQYARPGLLDVIPTGTQGALLSPLDAVAKGLNLGTYEKSWSPGDGGPVEASWWNSSDYPYAVMRLLALTKPAQFFALFADRDLYRYQEEFGQYLLNDRYRLDANGVQIYGDGVSKASFINWIVDYNRVLGINSTAELTADLQNLDIRLCYRMAAFSDKQYIKIYTERSSPNSTNTSLLITDDSYDLLLYKNQPFDRHIYSAVVIEKVEGGWAVYGYSTAKPYFNTFTAIPIGQFRTISVALNVDVTVPANYSDTITEVPYGTVFTTTSAVVTFLLGYGKYLESQGFEFTSVDNGYILTWDQMAQEFLYWQNQGWGNGTLINLNPCAFRLSVTKEQAVVDNLQAQTLEHVIMDQNRRDFPVRDLNIVRLNNTFAIEPLNNQSISFIDIRYTSYEHMIVMKNSSEFGDLIYEPITGARQNRLTLIAATTTEWNGALDAQGFILNQNNVQEWTGLRSYAKGEIVKYKGKYWSAADIVQPSTNFDYNNWNQSEYELIQQGLLPNISNKADQLANSYNINSANLESDNDLLSYGLIGFKPRQYFTALNLDDVSQLNVYRQFLDSKGTKQATDLIGFANLGKEAAVYQVYENWAILRATYGANANRSWVDLRLNRANLTSDPCLVQLIEPAQVSDADQTIVYENVYSSSFNLTGPDFLPVTTEIPNDIGLPTAGYVNLDDVDITVFDINDPTSLSANLSTIQVGTKIWVAKVNDYDWNIYRASQVPGSVQHICDNLNGTCRVIFSDQHGLARNDKLIIKFFDSEVDGVYTVVSVANLNTVNIVLSLAGGRTVIDGSGIGFTLDTMRIFQASDIINLPYAKEILPGAQVWIDDNGNGLWTVLQRENVFQSRKKLEPQILGASEQYGASVAQSSNRNVLLVGAPAYGVSSEGGIYLYTRLDQNEFVPISPLGSLDDIKTLNATDVVGFGNALDFGRNSWAAAGASQSLGPNGEADNGYVAVLASGIGATDISQLLVQPTTTDTTTPGPGEFGYAVSISDDERWMYISAPGLEKVHAYALIAEQVQQIRFRSDGSTTRIYIDESILIDNSSQLLVTIDGAAQTLGVNYTVSGGFDYIDFATAPSQGSLVGILRRNFLNYTGGSASYNLVNFLYTVNNIYSFTVTVDDVLQRPFIDYTFDGTNVVFTGGAVPATDFIGISAEAYWQFVDTIDNPGSAGDRFGTSLRASTDGRQVVVGAKNATVDGNTEAGIVYVYDRNAQKFIVKEANIVSASTIASGGTYTITSVGTTDFTAIGAAANTVGTFFTATGSSPAGTGQVIDNEFTVLNTIVGPASVIHNGTYLTNIDLTVPSAANTFEETSSSSVTLFVSIAVGDVIEVETNEFKLEQQLTQTTPAAFVNYGQSVDICPYDCSIYVGAPQDSTVAFKGGVVDSNQNWARLYGSLTASVANPSLTVGDTIRVNNVDCVVPTATGSLTSLQGLAVNITNNAPNANASVDNNGYLIISVTNEAAAVPTNKLQVAPGSIGTAFADLGLASFVYTQTISSPLPVDYGAFGTAVAINSNATTLAVGAATSNLYLPNTFDYNDYTQKPDTTFDGNATTFYSPVVNSGVVYTFDYFPAASISVQTPGNFVFGQQIGTNQVSELSQFGYSLNYRSGVLIAGAPGYLGVSPSYAGSAFVFENAQQDLAWKVKYVEQPTVDTRLLSSVYMYDSITSTKSEFFDFFNPLQGKILGAAQQNLNYIGAVDPAEYNVGPINNQGQVWGSGHVGEMWWNTSTVRFIDPNQDSIVYASRRWGQVFPGSSVDVYQWIESSVPPAAYAGVGTPLNITSYTINTNLSRDGTFVTKYYFWVKNVIEVYSQQGKTLNAASVASYIQNPRASGIAYVAPINASTIAIYNGLQYIIAADTILSIEYDQNLNDANVHTEYELISQGRADGFLSDNLYRKLQDSFCGTDESGNKVPDPFLSPALKYGVQFRPRQSMFADRFTALKNYITRCNSIFALYPFSESAEFSLLNSQDPVPSLSSGDYDVVVGTVEELQYEYEAPGGDTPGTKYLVLVDTTQRGLWTIYTVQLNNELLLTRVQNYKTSDYWSYVNWYLPGFNSSTQILAEVPNYATLASLNLPIGGTAKVTSNQQGKWEIYQYTPTGWIRVGLQDGTIELSLFLYDYAAANLGYDMEVFDAQYFDEEPVIETRKIIQAVNEQLFVGDLAIERNRALMLMFDFMLSEFKAPEWLTKTSLIDVDHNIRQLIAYPNYVRDNQDFVSDYIQEVKPYHVQVRAFNLLYNGEDDYPGDVTDFDLPAFYNTELQIPRFTSPILLPYAHATNQLGNTLSDFAANSQIWQKWPYSQWYQNYLLHMDSVIVENAGIGYTEPPEINVIGDCITPAELVANVNLAGEIISVDVVNPGSGYKQTPVLEIQQGNGSGGVLYPVMTNGLVRSFKTVIKFDRYQYNTTITNWSSSETYQVGDQVRFADSVWQATQINGPSAEFVLADWEAVAAGTLSGVDRTMGFYVPGINEPGLDLPLLINGIDYPGVQVYGKEFTSVEPLDAIYQGSFTDILGVGTTAINVDGGLFIDPYEGHAPEELVNGSEFDTLDFRVYTRSGSDWTFDGHGFPIAMRRFEYTQNSGTWFWGDALPTPVQILVNNVTTNLDLTPGIDYSIDWIAQTVNVIAGAGISLGDIVEIDVYGVGGGSQLFKEYVFGNNVTTFTIVPVSSAEIQEIALFINGQQYSGSSWEPYWPQATTWNILNSYAQQDVVAWGGFYWRAIQAVPVGIDITNAVARAPYWVEYNPTTYSKVFFPVTVTATDGIVVVVLGGPTSPITTEPYDSTDFDIGNTTNLPGSFDYSNFFGTQNSWSTPQVQYVTADAGIVSTNTLTLTNPVPGTNPMTLVLTRNGLRLTPPAGIEWTGDDSQTSFGLPQRLGASFSQNLINGPTEVVVYVNNELQTYGVEYTVSAYTGANDRVVEFGTPPTTGAEILIFVTTLADYSVVTGSPDTIVLNSTPSIGDIFAVTTWNDTSQQNINTLVFYGPDETAETVIVTEPYDSTPFDDGTVTGSAGSFDYSSDVPVARNNFFLNRPDITANRVWVTLNGYRLQQGQEFTVENNYLILASGTISPSDILVVTEFTENTVPDAIAFRIFQDMRGIQLTYRMTPETTTTLSQPANALADEIYVENINALSNPALAQGIFGVITINGERIMYRGRDVINSKITGCLRGTAGTAAADHPVGATVYDMGLGNLLSTEYQDRIYKDSIIANGSTTVFDAPNVPVSSESAAIEVYVGGVLQTSGYTISFTTYPTVTFTTAPTDGYEVTIAARLGLSWYQPGIEEASDGIALQETNTPAARFLRGLS